MPLEEPALPLTYPSAASARDLAATYRNPYPGRSLHLKNPHYPPLRAPSGSMFMGGPKGGSLSSLQLQKLENTLGSRKYEPRSTQSRINYMKDHEGGKTEYPHSQLAMIFKQQYVLPFAMIFQMFRVIDTYVTLKCSALGACRGSPFGAPLQSDSVLILQKHLIWQMADFHILFHLHCINGHPAS